MRLNQIWICALLLLACGLSGCDHDPRPIEVDASALRAIDAINETSAAAYRNSATEIHVGEGGSVELVMRGELQAKPEAEGDVWIPMLLSKRLPEYFAATDAAETTKFTVEAYQLVDGLWCIAAVVSAPILTSPAANQIPAPTQVDLRLTIVSPSLSKGLPFLVPTDQTGDPVAVMVDLSKGVRFTNASTQIGATEVRGWRNKKDFDGARLTTLRSMTPFPQALSPDAARVATTLYESDAIALDFSTVQFDQRSASSTFKSWFYPATWLIAFAAVALGIQWIYLPMVRSNAEQIRQQREQQLQSLELDIQQFSERLSHSTDIDSSEIWSDLLKTWTAAQYEIRSSIINDAIRFRPQFFRARQNWDQDEHRNFPALNVVRVKLEKARQSFKPQDKSALLIDRILSNVDTLSLRVSSLRALNVDVASELGRLSFAAMGTWIAWTIAVCSALFLMATYAGAQTQASSPKPRVTTLSMLGDLDIELIPHNIETPSFEEVDVQLRFSPLTADAKQKTMELVLGSGVPSSITINPIPTPADQRVVVKSNSNSQISLQVPTTFSPMLKRIGALANLMREFKVPSGYAKEIEVANRIAFLYTLHGSTVLDSRPSFAKRWLHRFPFDSAEITIPIDIRHAALLRRLLLAKPSTNYFADVSVEGLPVALNESRNADRYEFLNSDAAARTPLWNDQRPVVRAKFQRSSFQRIGLMFGLPFVAILTGLLIGWIYTVPEKAWQSYIVSVLSASGVVYGVHSAVLSSNKDLPTLLTGQGITYFEINFIVCVIVMTIVAWSTQRAIGAGKATPPKKK